MRLDRFNTTRTVCTKLSQALECPEDESDRLDIDHSACNLFTNTVAISYTHAERHTTTTNIHEDSQKESTPPNRRYTYMDRSPLTFRRVSKENDKYFVTYYYSQAISGLIINLVHLFLGPLSIPILTWFYGKNLMHAMVFDINIIYILGDFTSWLWVFLTLLFDYFNPDIRSQMAVIYIATGSVVVLRQIMVSLKYGFYSKKKWEMMKNTKVSLEFILQNLILQVWVTVPADIAQKEIMTSFRKQKLNPNIMMVKFAYMPEYSPSNKEEAEESYDTYSVVDNEVSILQLAKYLVNKVTKTQKVSELNIIYLFGVFYVLSFVILRYYAFGMAGFRADPFEIIYTFLSAYKAYIASSQFVMFIAAGLYDFKRKRMLMAQCTGVISRVDHKYLLFKGTDMPEMDLTDPATILNWYHLRRTFLDFGRRYTLRVFLYASLVFPVCVSVVVMLLLQLSGIIGVKYNYYLVPCLMLTLEVFLLLIYMSYAALSLNKTFAVHRDLLLENFIKAKDKQKINLEAISNLAFVMERLKHDEIVRPVTILGLAITEDLIVKLLIVIMSGLFAVIQLAIRK